MRIFVTGASGWIGSAVVAELLAADHQVVGLARSDQSAQAVQAAGAEVLRGDIDDLDALRTGARDSDGVVHLAFRHDVAFSGDFETAVASDLAAIETLGEALAGTDRPLAVASGTAGLKPGAVATERDVAEPFPGAGGRVVNERVALGFSERGVRSMSVRFAPTVHGDGDYGFVPMVVTADRAAGSAAYIGDGTNRWPAVHRSDPPRPERPSSVPHPATWAGTSPGFFLDHLDRGGVEPSRFGLARGLIAVTVDDLRHAPGPALALDQPLKTESHCFRNDWRRSRSHEVVDLCDQPVVDLHHELRHTATIAPHRAGPPGSGVAGSRSAAQPATPASTAAAWSARASRSEEMPRLGVSTSSIRP